MLLVSLNLKEPLHGLKIGFSQALMQGRASNLMKWTLDEMDLTIHLSSLEYFAELVGAIKLLRGDLSRIKRFLD